MDLVEQEARDGVRFSWNCWPCSRIEAARIVVPLATVVTPLREIADLPVLAYEPVRCRTCRGVLNPYCQMDFLAKLWHCPLCGQRNHFPQTYAQISPELLPAELFSQHVAVEYVLQQPAAQPPVFLFMLDVALQPDEMEGLKGAMRQALSLLPDTSLVGLITFGSLVYVHDLTAADMPRAFVFRGDRETGGKEVRAMLGMASHGGGPAAAGQRPGSKAAGRFLVPLSECEYVLEALIGDLQPEPGNRRQGERARRATGAAVGVAVGMLEACAAGMGGRLMLLTAGPCTVGPGVVVGLDLAEPFRNHKDFDKGDVRYFKKSLKYYEGLAQRLVDNGQALDVFACALDQVGLAEMQPAVQSTGGLMVMAEEFTHDIFVDSLVRLFARDGEDNLRMAFNATIDVNASKDIKVEGAIGQIASLRRKGQVVSETETGIGRTCAWKTCVMDSRSAVAFFFEVTAAAQAPAADQPALYLQFTTAYTHPSGQHRLRVVTVARRWAAPGAAEIAFGFDQEAAAVVVARLTAYKCEKEESFDVLRWIDRTLIRLASRFADYTKDVPSSFVLPEQFSLFPQFMFHMRRSQFLQVFGNSPDETAFFRMMLSREGVSNGVTMIQPMLMSYSLDGPPRPALLDVASIQPDHILLLDDYFHLVVLYGNTIAQWRQQGYHENPEFENFRELLAAPIADAKELQVGRLPVPRIIESDQGKSQSRFLLAKVNPSATHASSDPAYGGNAGELIYTDDVSLEVFLDHLKKLSVQG